MGYVKRSFGLGLALGLLMAAPASAGVPHVVQPGESLWSIAAANNFTTRALAAANGLSENSAVVLGSTIQIPSVSEAAGAMQSAGITPAAQQPAATSTASAPQGGYAVQPGDTLSGIAASHGVSLSALAAANGLSTTSFAIAGTTLRIPSASAAPTASSTSSGPPPLGGYTVRPGDSLSGIAAQAGVSIQQLAWMNGLDPSHYLLAGTVIKLPTGSAPPSNPNPAPGQPGPAAPSKPNPAPAQTIVPAAAPNPTPERVGSSQIAPVAAQHGVPASLAS